MNPPQTDRRMFWLSRSILLLCLLLMPCATGCQALALAARALPAPTIPPKYPDLKGQSVAVMVWAQRADRIEWPALQLDVSAGVRSKLQQAVGAKVDSVEGCKFPVTADVITRMQEEHPEWAADSIEDIAPKIGVSRLIYIEIDGIQTRSDSSVELYRGTLTGRIKVLEVRDGKARVAMTEEGLRVIYPHNAPEEGVTNKNDYDIYRMTLDAFTTDVSLLFIPHSEDDIK